MFFFTVLWVLLSYIDGIETILWTSKEILKCNYKNLFVHNSPQVPLFRKGAKRQTFYKLGCIERNKATCSKLINSAAQ